MAISCRARLLYWMLDWNNRTNTCAFFSSAIEGREVFCLYTIDIPSVFSIMFVLLLFVFSMLHLYLTLLSPSAFCAAYKKNRWLKHLDSEHHMYTVHMFWFGCSVLFLFYFDRRGGPVDTGIYGLIRPIFLLFLFFIFCSFWIFANSYFYWCVLILY